MDTTSKKLDDNKQEITVSLSADEVQVEIDKAYKQAGKNRIPGFRPGKAPRKILENHFGGKQYFQAQATDELVRTYTPLAPDELNLVPMNNPDFKEFDLAEEGQPFEFSFTIEVAPELELSSYDPVQIELPSAEPTEEEMQAQIDALLSYNLSTDEEGNEQKPELTDAWVKETLEFDSVDEFKERLSESIREQKGQDLPMLREIRSTQELASRLEGDVPDSLVKQVEQDNYRDLFQSLQKQHMTLDSYIEAYGMTPETFRESMHLQALNSAATTLALDALARHLQFKVTDEEVQGEFEKSGVKDPQKLFEDWRRNGRLTEIRQGILRMKASEHLIETAEIFEPGTLHPVEEEPEETDQQAGEPVTETAQAEEAKPQTAKKSRKADAEQKEASGEQEQVKKTEKKTQKNSKEDSKSTPAEKKKKKASETDDTQADTKK